MVSVKKDIEQAGGRSPREQEESGRLDALELAHGNASDWMSGTPDDGLRLFSPPSKQALQGPAQGLQQPR